MSELNKNILTGLLIVLFLVSVWYFSAIFIYILVAVLVSLLGQPLVGIFKKISIRKYKVGDGVGAMLALLSIFIIVAAFFSLFIPLIIEEARIISSISVQDVLNSFNEPVTRIDNFLNEYKVSNGGSFSIEDKIRTTLASFLNFAALSSFVNSCIGAIGDVVIGIFSVAFMAFFFLKDKNLISNTVVMLTPAKYDEAVRKIMSHSKVLLRKYFIGVIIESLCVTILTFIGLLILGVENALIIAFLSGILNIIPYVGPLIAGAIGIIIGISGNLDLEFYGEMVPFIIKLTIMYGSIQFIDNMFLQPLIFSNTVNAHPLEIFIVIMVAATLAGIGGMIVAIPVYSVLRIVARQFFSNFRVVRKLTEDLEGKV